MAAAPVTNVKILALNATKRGRAGLIRQGKGQNLCPRAAGLIILLLGAAHPEGWVCLVFFFLFFLISKDQLGQHAFHHSYIIRDGTNMTFFFSCSLAPLSHHFLCKRRKISSETYRAETSTVRFPSKPRSVQKASGRAEPLVCVESFFKLALV